MSKSLVDPMKSPLIAYNPAEKDGIHAKIWECLRRNTEFCDLLNRLRANDSKRREVARQQLSSLLGNTLVRIAFLVSVYPAKYPAIEKKHWNEIPDDIREIVNDAAFKSMPRCVPPPPHDLIAGLMRESGRRKIATWFFAAQHLWHEHIVIAVPKLIRDTAHKKEVVAELRKILPDRLVSALKLRDGIPSGGKLLGTKRDWEVFLFIEDLVEQRGFPKGQALELSALRFYDTVEFETHPLSYFRTPAGLKQAEAAYAWRGEKIDSHLLSIQSGLKLVYPDFKVFPNPAAVTPTL